MGVSGTITPMTTFPKGTKTVLARCVAAEVRGRIGATRVSGRSVAALIGLSQNYFAMRLRDEASFSTDDLGRLADYFGVDAHVFVEQAVTHHSAWITAELTAAIAAADIEAVASADRGVDLQPQIARGSSKKSRRGPQG